MDLVCGGYSGGPGIPYQNLWTTNPTRRTDAWIGGSMAGHVVNLFVIMAVGVILADMIAHASGTNALFGGMASLWKIGVNGMLGNPS